MSFFIQFFIGCMAFFLFAISTHAATLFTRDLFVGIKNDSDVVRLQEFLRAKNFFTYPESTGNYFTVTKNAVIKFQLAHNIEPAVGYFGPLTRKKVNEALIENTEPIISTESFQRDLYFGLRSDDDVTRLQEVLRLLGFFTHPESTGNFFEVTKEAIQRYQQSRALSADGAFRGTTRFFINQEILAGIIPTDGESIAMPPAPKTATSTFYKKITIRRFSGKSSDPLNETVRVYNTTRDESINITGWQLKTANGRVITIPRVYNLPGVAEPVLQNLVLSPRGTVTITPGKQELGINFRENMCTGYFLERAKFKPSLSRSCPRPDTGSLLYLDDKCLTTIKGISSCRTPSQEDFFARSSECSDYMIKNLNYAGCVRNYQHVEDFFEDEWYIWLQRDTEMFRNIHDVITLYDINGLFVDRREY